MSKLFEKVDKNTEICQFDGVTSCGVYIGVLSSLECVTDKLEWHVADGYAVPLKTLTLDEIREQALAKVGYGLIAVIREGCFEGDIIQYGNHGDYWEVVGELGGYA